MKLTTLRRIILLALIGASMGAGVLSAQGAETALARPKVDGGSADCATMSGAEANLVLGRLDLDVHAQYLVCRYANGTFSVNLIQRGVYR